MILPANLNQIDVVILCGGLGTRLKPVVSDRPKVLAKIGDTAFLNILLSSLAKYELKNIILCVGYLKEQIKVHFNSNKIYNIKFSEDDEPLGTGGALKKAKTIIKSNPFIVMNGDSICNINFREFYEFHINKKGILSMVLTKTKKVQDFGSVMLDNSQRITSFKEKAAYTDECLVNAGVYLMQKEVFYYMLNESCFSLEYDLFPRLIKSKCYGFITESELIDIGTPERYEKAINLIGELK